VTINDLLGEPYSFDIIIASQFDTILNVAVWRRTGLLRETA
jgi:hypothetical protein